MKDNYKELMNGIPYETVSKRIEDTVPDGDGEKTALSWTEMGNYAEVKDHLTIQLVGRKGNEGLLWQIPHCDMEDLAVIYRIQILKNNFGAVFATVTNAMLEQYGITEEQLHRDAVEASSIHQPYVIRTMAETLNKLCGFEWKKGRCLSHVYSDQ